MNDPVTWADLIGVSLSAGLGILVVSILTSEIWRNK